MPQIEVTFDIDANGIVNVSAKDLGTGKEQKITITASCGLTKDEVERMMRDAESHADEDKKRREEIETRNRADRLVYAAEKTLSENRRQAAGAPTSRRPRRRSTAATQGRSRRASATAIEAARRGADAGLAQAGRGALQAGVRGAPGAGRRPRSRRRGGGPGQGRTAT